MRPAVFCASGLALFFCSLLFFMRPLSRLLRRCKKSSLSLSVSMERSGFIFTAKAEELIDERIVRKLEREGALLR